METKTYKLQSAKLVMPVLVRCTNEEEVVETVAYINYGQDTVHFPNNPELNTDEMRRAILAEFDFPLDLNIPQVPSHLMDQVEQLRSGAYPENPFPEIFS